MPDPDGLTLDNLGDRSFSFYPAILNFEHNEWRMGRGTWSEILVVNAKTGQEVWIPRRLVGEVVRVDAPVVIVGLRKELEYKAGAVWPRDRRLLAMPRMGGAPAGAGRTPDAPPRSGAEGPAPGAEAKIGRLIGGALALAIDRLVLLPWLRRYATA